MPFCVGIDENGLGPQLGPLIVTAVAARATPDAARRMTQDPRSFLHERLADSKKLVSHQHVVLGEAWARALAGDARDPDHLVRRLTIEPMEALQAWCPPAALPQCWSTDGEGFRSSEGALAQARKDLERLRDLGVDVSWVRCSITCVLRMNEARRAGVGRLDLDLRSMEALLVAAREEAGEDIDARCGKVGGLMRYVSKFTQLSGYLATVIEEQPSESAYRLAGLGEVRFLRDAEERDPLVSLASLVGKWVRETLMGRIVAFHRRHDEQLPDASGYNDPVTERFVLGSEEIRARLGIPERCFLREGRKR